MVLAGPQDIFTSEKLVAVFMHTQVWEPCSARPHTLTVSSTPVSSRTRPHAEHTVVVSRGPMGASSWVCDV